MSLHPFLSWYPGRESPPQGLGLGARVRFLRRSAGLRQSDLAEKVGLTRASIANIEAGRQALTSPVARCMANVFGVSLDVLYGPRGQFYADRLR